MNRRVIILVACTLLMGGAAAASAYEETGVTNGGKIVGSVRVVGEVPSLPPQPVYKHAADCGDTVRDERLMTGKKGELRNAVVFLDGVQSGKPIQREQPVALDNVKCAFVPHVLAAAVGQTLAIHNSDSFLHDAHAYIGPRTLFNVAVPQGRTVSRVLGDEGVVLINCNVRHTWMQAIVYVGENPYSAVTDDAGGYVIEDVEPGTYTLRVWHELLGSVDRRVTVESGKSTRLDFDIPAAAAEVH